MKTALISGAAGQDGRYLTEHLLSKRYHVYRLYRRHDGRGLPRFDDTTDIVADAGLVTGLPPVDEVYNLAAQSHVGHSFSVPRETIENNLRCCINLLEHARECGAKFYQASTSELFGDQGGVLDEHSPMHPRSPYGVSKKACYDLTINYREAYGLETYNGILFNHESPLRGDDFVTQKICKAAAAREVVKLGDIHATRDWGHAEDYVKAMHMMIQAEPGEYVVATGKAHTVKDVCEIAYAQVGLEWQDYVIQSSELLRPSDIHYLLGDATKMRALGWYPRWTFQSMIKGMVNALLPVDHATE